MKPKFKREGGPGTKPCLFITSLGGVKAVMTNPFAWSVDPCIGCFPWPHRADTQGASPELESGPPPALWQAKGGPVTAEMNRPAESKPTNVFAAPLGSTTPTTTAPTTTAPTTTAPTTTAPTTTTATCTPPQYPVKIAGGQIKCVYPFGS